ncbi:MAG: FliH/SctL family protein [Mariprofundaceae bacterium]
MALTPLPVETIESKILQPNKPLPYPVFGESAAAVASAAMPASAEVQRMQQLEQMLQESQGRAETVEREAYDKAYAAGEKAGLALGEKRAEQILELLQQHLNQAEIQTQQLKDHCVDAVMDITQALTEHLVGEMMQEQRDTLFKAAQRAAEQLPDAGKLRLAVHPDDIESFNRLIQEQDSDWKLHVDTNITAGSCRLISEHQDALIHPSEAIIEAVKLIRTQLQNDNHHVVADD